MCDMATETKILEMIDKRIEDGEPFSAFDITRPVLAEVIQGGGSGRHGELKGEIHKAFHQGRMGDWGRSLVRFPNAPRPAWLYHPPGFDVSSYEVSLSDPKDAGVGPVPASTHSSPYGRSPMIDALYKDKYLGPICSDPLMVNAVPAGLGTAIPATTSGPGTGVVRDPGTECLYVPRKMARKVGIQPGGPAYMKASGRSIEISPPQYGGSGLTDGCPGFLWKKAHVDINGNVRVPITALLKSGLTGSVRVEVNGDKIVVGSPLGWQR